MRQAVDGKQVGDPEAEQQGCHQVAFLSLSLIEHRKYVSVSFNTMVEGAVVAMPVTVVLTVGIVVLMVKGDQVTQGKNRRDR